MRNIATAGTLPPVDKSGTTNRNYSLQVYRPSFDTNGFRTTTGFDRSRPDSAIHDHAINGRLLSLSSSKRFPDVSELPAKSELDPQVDVRIPPVGSNHGANPSSDRRLISAVS